MYDILVIGSLNMDMVIHTNHIPLPGETLMGKFSAYLPGGKGANQAYAAGRLGQSTAMMGRIGHDTFGAALMNSLRSAHVDTDMITYSDEQTGQAIIYVSDKGENSIVVLSGANQLCDVNYIRSHEQQIAESRTVMLQLEIPFDAVCEAICISSRHGCRVILNPAPALKPLPTQILPLIDYITPNETELSILTGMNVNTPEEAIAAAQSLIASGVRSVVATLGSQGALYVSDGIVRLYPAQHVVPVDTTAAGDTFNAAFAVKITEGVDISDAIIFANAAAGISVTHVGAQPSIPNRSEVEKYLKEEIANDPL